jgi:hypothetical protein
LLVVAPALFVYAAAQSPSNEESKPLPSGVVLIVRAVWLAIALLGLVALIGDIQDITE